MPTDRIMYDVRESPRHRDGEKRETEEDVVYERHNDHVRNPHALTVEVRRVGVWLAVSDTDIHILAAKNIHSSERKDIRNQKKCRKTKENSEDHKSTEVRALFLFPSSIEATPTLVTLYTFIVSRTLNFQLV